MYMFHGGSTRGFMNGANFKDTSPYEPQTSSYDYDAPLDEAGNATDKFMKFREVIQKHLPYVLPEVPKAKPSITTPMVKFTTSASLYDVLPVPTLSARPLTFESMKQAYGYVLYRTTLNGGKRGLLKIKELRDYGMVFVNGKRLGTLDRRLGQDSLELNLPAGKVTLDILVENMGRINFGIYMLENTKGITEKVVFAGRELKGWKMFGLPFDHLPSLKSKVTKAIPGVPIVRKGILTLDKPADTYLDLSKWGKGVVWINGHHLGKYWEIGPQQTIYVPAEWLKRGENEVVVFELNKSGQSLLRGIEKPVLNKLK